MVTSGGSKLEELVRIHVSISSPGHVRHMGVCDEKISPEML